MPRRNRSVHARRRQYRGGSSAKDEASRLNAYDAMALHLVETGKCSRLILGQISSRLAGDIEYRARHTATH